MDYVLNVIKDNVKVLFFIIVGLVIISSIVAVLAQRKDAKFLKVIFWASFFSMMALSSLVLLSFAPFYIAIAPLIPLAMYIYVLTSRSR